MGLEKINRIVLFQQSTKHTEGKSDAAMFFFSHASYITPTICLSVSEAKIQNSIFSSVLKQTSLVLMPGGVLKVLLFYPFARLEIAH